MSLIQLREKHLSAKDQYELALELVTITRGSETRLLINDRPDIASAAGADGVHLTAKSLTATVVRAAFGSKMLIGVSTHSTDDVENARVGGADFAVIGPVFDSPGKLASLGIASLSGICDAVGSFPVLALGGIDGSNYGCVIEAGAAGFAGIRSLNDPGSLSEIMTEIARD